MVNIFAFLYIFQTQGILLEGFIVTSQNTPYSLTQALQAIQSPNTTFQFFQYSSETLTYIHQYPPVFIVDASSSLIFSHNLQSLSQKLGVVLFKIGKPQENRSQWTFYSSPSFYYENQALDSLIAYFDWESFHLFSSEKLLSLPSAKHFQNNFQGINGDLNILTDTLGIDVFTLYIGRLIKPTGNWKMLIFNEKESSQKIIESLEKMKMMRKGCGVILKFSGLTQVQKGLIVVAEEGTQTSSDFYDFQVKQIQLMISLLEDIFQSLFLNHVVSNDRVRQELERLTEKGGRIPKYLILNSKEENILTEVGRIEGTEVNITETLILPGGQTQFTNDILQIRYSQHSGFIDHQGYFDIPNYVFMGAIWIYLDIINSDDNQLQNFKLVPTEVNCGSSIFYYDYFKQCYQGLRNSLGVFYLHASSSITLDVLLLWRELELPNFQIGYYSQTDQIYDKEQYPQIVFSTAPQNVTFGFLPTFIAYHGWKNLLVAQAQIYKQIGTSQSFYQNCENLEMTIWNSQQTRTIPNYYKFKTDFQTYKHYFQEYYNSGVRIFIILFMHDEFLNFIYSLYQIGFRQGDIQILTLFQSVINLQDDSFSDQDMKKVYSLLNGIVWIDTAQYVGQFETTLKPLVQEALGFDTINSSCFAMDQLQLGAYAIDNLLTTGRDYQDENLVNDSVRMQRFSGCSGTFSIDSSSNERRDFSNTLGYTLYNIDTGEKVRYESGSYSPVQNPVFQVYGEFEYSNGSTTPPSDMRFEEWDCDFHKEIVLENEKSLNLKAILIGGAIGFSIIASFFFLFAFKMRQGFYISTEQNVMGLDDLSIILSVAIENIQYLMIGPDFSRLNPFFYSIGNYISISIMNVYSWRFQDFWIFYNVFLGLASFWIILIGMYFMTLVSRTMSKVLLVFKEAGENVMPGLVNILLVPVLMVLFSVLDCEEGISEELQDSFMTLDCDTFCWKGNHLHFVIGGLVIIILLCIFTLGYRLIYSSYVTHKNIRILPLYNYLKGILQLVLVSLNTLLKTRYSFTFDVLFCVIVIVYLVFSYKLQVYNYKRLQLMQVFAICGVLWSILLTTVFDLATRGEINFSCQVVFQILQITGWTLILFLFYFAYKKQPSMFYKFKVRHNVTELFRFMFGKQELKNTQFRSKNAQARYLQEGVCEEFKPKGLTTGGIIR